MDWGYNSYGLYVTKVSCAVKLYNDALPGTRYGDATLNSNIGDLAAIELMLHALEVEPCYHPDAPSSVSGLTQRQLFYVTSCMGHCGSKASIANYVVGGPQARRDHRCNVVSLHFRDFRAAFKCPSITFHTCRIITETVFG